MSSNMPPGQFEYSSSGGDKIALLFHDALDGVVEKLGEEEGDEVYFGYAYKFNTRHMQLARTALNLIGIESPESVVISSYVCDYPGAIEYSALASLSIVSLGLVEHYNVNVEFDPADRSILGISTLHRIKIAKDNTTSDIADLESELGVNNVDIGNLAVLYGLLSAILYELKLTENENGDGADSSSSD